MLYMHSQTGDMSDLGRRFVACFDAAMGDASLPDDPEFRAAMHAYMEWAVSDVLVYSPKDAPVPPDLATPKWSWNGLEATAS